MYYIDTPKEWCGERGGGGGGERGPARRPPPRPPAPVPPGSVYAFDYDAATGGLSGQLTAFAIPPGTGHPDGCCIDAEGNVWVAQWGGSRVVAYRPADGSVLAEVRLPAAHVSSVTFGGPGLRDLYITTAKEHLSPAEREAQPHAGCSFLVRDCGFTGVPAAAFSG